GRTRPRGAGIGRVARASTEQWKDRSTAERRGETEWHRGVVYSRLAELGGESLRKGRSIYVEGRLKTRKWQDKETGQDRYSTEIVADQMQMLGGRGDDMGGGGGGGGADDFNQAPARAPQRPAPAQKRPAAQVPAHLAAMDDDIPF